MTNTIKTLFLALSIATLSILGTACGLDDGGGKKDPVCNVDCDPEPDAGPGDDGGEPTPDAGPDNDAGPTDDGGTPPPADCQPGAYAILGTNAFGASNVYIGSSPCGSIRIFESPGNPTNSKVDDKGVTQEAVTCTNKDVATGIIKADAHGYIRCDLPATAPAGNYRFQVYNEACPGEVPHTDSAVIGKVQINAMCPDQKQMILCTWYDESSKMCVDSDDPKCDGVVTKLANGTLVEGTLANMDEAVLTPENCK